MIQEKGHIYFFYRPKVEHKEAKSLDDVQRLEIVLTPGTVQLSAGRKDTKGKQQSTSKLNRLLVVPRKVLPPIKKTGPRNKHMAMIYGVSNSLQQLNEEFRKETYQTKTRGERTLEAARPVGEGVYSVVEHGRHTHLLYVLEMPSQIGEVQEAFNIEKEGSYIIAVKNPTMPPTPDSRLEASPAADTVPQKLLDKFEDRKWATQDLPDILNYPGIWLLLLGASDDLKQEFGENVKEIEDLEETDLKLFQKAHRNKKPLEEKLFDELRLNRKEFPVDPLIKGTWK